MKKDVTKKTPVLPNGNTGEKVPKNIKKPPSAN
jgi:hypothetical protein